MINRVIYNAMGAFVQGCKDKEGVSCFFSKILFWLTKFGSIVHKDFIVFKVVYIIVINIILYKCLVYSLFSKDIIGSNNFSLSAFFLVGNHCAEF